MPQFEFQGRSGNGQLVDGEIEGASTNAVAGLLMERGVMIAWLVLACEAAESTISSFHTKMAVNCESPEKVFSGCCHRT